MDRVEKNMRREHIDDDVGQAPMWACVAAFDLILTMTMTMKLVAEVPKRADS